MDTVYALVFMISVLGLIWANYKEKQRMQRTIDELTNKLMARDFKEYIAMATPPQPEKPKRERQSWYDTEEEIEDVQ